MKTLSMHLRASMAATSNCITTFPWSVLLFHETPRLKMLPVDLPSRIWQIMAVTLRHRTPRPIVVRFLECAREVSQSIASSRSRQEV